MYQWWTLSSYTATLGCFFTIRTVDLPQSSHILFLQRYCHVPWAFSLARSEGSYLSVILIQAPSAKVGFYRTMTPENPSKVVVSSKNSSDGFICKRESLSLHPSSLLFAGLSINPIIKAAANLCTKTQNNTPANLSRAAARPAFGEEGSAGR